MYIMPSVIIVVLAVVLIISLIYVFLSLEDNWLNRATLII